jgi:hypothetical protein
LCIEEVHNYVFCFQILHYGGGIKNYETFVARSTQGGSRNEHRVIIYNAKGSILLEINTLRTA